MFSRTPIRRIRSGCCAHAANGHAATPPRSAMNSRRFTASASHASDRKDSTPCRGWRLSGCGISIWPMTAWGHSRRRRAMAGSRPCPETPKTGRSVDGWRHLFRCACRGNRNLYILLTPTPRHHTRGRPRHRCWNGRITYVFCRQNDIVVGGTWQRGNDSETIGEPDRVPHSSGS
jgi:hypothetical protein